jgi:hypothetical protein
MGKMVPQVHTVFAGKAAVLLLRGLVEVVLRELK